MPDDTLAFLVVGAALFAFALVLRLAVHVGATPGGVDTWYYLASAKALRHSRRLPISLPQYLLQDRTESYPPGFIVLLALVPGRILERWSWLVSPVTDSVHLLLLYVVSYRLTGSIAAAALGGAVYAMTPQLIAETRSLNPRALGVLLGSVAMLLILRATLPEEATVGLRLGTGIWPIGALAVMAAAALFLTHTTTAVVFGISTLVLTVVFADARYVAYAAAGFAAAFVVSGGFYVRVLANHVHAVRFWRRNIRYRDAHQILDSPIYGDRTARPLARPVRWRSLRWQAVRLVGENPFVIPMLLTPLPVLALEWWGQRMYWWALAVMAWAVATTFVPVLRVLGPGYLYLKASIFPTAFSLAVAVGSFERLRSPLGLVLAAAMAASLAAIAFFIVFVRTRRTERTSSVPAGLVQAVEHLRSTPGDGVLVLPTMYADHVCYHSGKRTLWGGHSGDLGRFEAVSPVIRRPIEDLIREYDLQYVLLDGSYATPDQLRLDDRLTEIGRWGAFTLFAVRSSLRARGVGV